MPTAVHAFAALHDLFDHPLDDPLDDPLGNQRRALRGRLRVQIGRPLLGWAQYRTPIAGLYLGSSYAHPGAGVHGACGANAALAALADLR